VTKPQNGRSNRFRLPSPETTRTAARRITPRFAWLLAIGLAACSSPPIDEYLTGWQAEHDAQTHAFAHDSFALNREAGAQAAALARSRSLNWPHYAEPLLRTATRSRTIHQAQGRALVLERFLAYMRTAPDVAAAEQWFAGQVQAVEAAATATGDDTAAEVRAFGAPLPMSEESFGRVTRAAATEGRVRGEAMQLADLRRTAANYFRRPGYDKGMLTFNRVDWPETVPDERLLANVDSRLGWAELRQAILQPRSCAPEGAAVTCATAPGGTPPPVAEDEPMAPPPQRSLLPGESIRWAEPKVRAPDLLDRRPGW
jgi:predicted outer membrane protein